MLVDYTHHVTSPINGLNKRTGSYFAQWRCFENIRTYIFPLLIYDLLSYINSFPPQTTSWFFAVTEAVDTYDGGVLVFSMLSIQPKFIIYSLRILQLPVLPLFHLSFSTFLCISILPHQSECFFKALPDSADFFDNVFVHAFQEFKDGKNLFGGYDLFFFFPVLSAERQEFVSG